MLRRFAGKGVVVTDGTREIGRAIVERAAAEGAHVVFCGRRGTPDTAADFAGNTSRQVVENGGSVAFVAADVSVEAEVEAFFDEVSDKLTSIDVVIHNADFQRSSLLVDTTLESWNEVLTTNLRSAFLVCRRAVEEFVGTGTAGRIVNVGSVAANGLVGGACYAASNAALTSLTRTVAKEYGRRGISCNAVASGFVDTDMIAGLDDAAWGQRNAVGFQGRLASVDEVVNAVLFLASDSASFITGETLRVADGTQDLLPCRARR